MSTSISFRQIAKVYDTLVEQGLNSFDVQEHLLGKGILADIAEAIKLGKIPDRAKLRAFLKLFVDKFNLTVDYSKTYADLVDSGNYEVDQFIAPHVVWVGTKEVKEIGVELLNVGDTERTFSGVLYRMQIAGYRPATALELLTFGAKYPEVPRSAPVVSLYSTVQIVEGDYPVHLALDYRSGKRCLVRYWRTESKKAPGEQWLGMCEFLMVKKIQ